MLLKISQYLQENNFIKMTPNCQYCEIFKNAPILKNICEQVLLKVKQSMKQNLWNNVKKSREIGQDEKTLISIFA